MLPPQQLEDNQTLPDEGEETGYFEDILATDDNDLIGDGDMVEGNTTDYDNEIIVKQIAFETNTTKVEEKTTIYFDEPVSDIYNDTEDEKWKTIDSVENSVDIKSNAKKESAVIARTPQELEDEGKESPKDEFKGNVSMQSITYDIETEEENVLPKLFSDYEEKVAETTRKSYSAIPIELGTEREVINDINTKLDDISDNEIENETEIMRAGKYASLDSDAAERPAGGAEEANKPSEYIEAIEGNATTDFFSDTVEESANAENISEIEYIQINMSVSSLENFDTSDNEVEDKYFLPELFSDFKGEIEETGIADESVISNDLVVTKGEVLSDYSLVTEDSSDSGAASMTNGDTLSLDLFTGVQPSDNSSWLEETSEEHGSYEYDYENYAFADEDYILKDMNRTKNEIRERNLAEAYADKTRDSVKDGQNQTLELNSENIMDASDSESLEGLGSLNKKEATYTKVLDSETEIYIEENYFLDYNEGETMNMTEDVKSEQPYNKDLLENSTLHQDDGDFMQKKSGNSNENKSLFTDIDIRQEMNESQTSLILKASNKDTVYDQLYSFEDTEQESPLETERSPDSLSEEQVPHTLHDDGMKEKNQRDMKLDTSVYVQIQNIDQHEIKHSKQSEWTTYTLPEEEDLEAFDNSPKIVGEDETWKLNVSLPYNLYPQYELFEGSIVEEHEGRNLENTKSSSEVQSQPMSDLFSGITEDIDGDLPESNLEVVTLTDPKSDQEIDLESDLKSDQEDNLGSDLKKDIENDSESDLKSELNFPSARGCDCRRDCAVHPDVRLAQTSPAVRLTGEGLLVTTGMILWNCWLTRKYL